VAKKKKLPLLRLLLPLPPWKLPLLLLPLMLLLLLTLLPPPTLLLLPLTLLPLLLTLLRPPPLVTNRLAGEKAGLRAGFFFSSNSVLSPRYYFVI